MLTLERMIAQIHESPVDIRAAEGIGSDASGQAVDAASECRLHRSASDEPRLIAVVDERLHRGQ